MVVYILVFKPMENMLDRVLYCIDEGVLAIVNIVSFAFLVGKPNINTIKVTGI